MLGGRRIHLDPLSRGSLTLLSRAGFGVTPAKSSAIARCARVFRIDSRAAPLS